MTAPLGLPFGGFVSFLRSPVCQDLDALDADIAIVGFPCDEFLSPIVDSRSAPSGPVSETTKAVERASAA